MKKHLLILLAILIPAFASALELKQSTGVTVHIGPFVDVGDGFVPETAVTLGAADEAELLKHDATAVVDISGAPFSAIASADGWYQLFLSTTDTNTVGNLTIAINDDDVFLPMFATFEVVDGNWYDSKHGVSGVSLGVNVAMWSGVSIPAGSVQQGGYPTVTIKDGTGTGEINTSSGRVGINLDDTAGDISAAEIAADAIGSSEIAADAIGASEIATDAIDADAIAASAIGTSEFAAEADNIGINWADISNQTTAVDLSGTTIEWLGDSDQSGVTIAAVIALGDAGIAQLDTAGDTVTVTSLAANVITSASINDGAISDVDVDDDVSIDVVTIEGVDATDQLDTAVAGGAGSAAAVWGYSADLRTLSGATIVWAETTRELSAFDEDNTTIDIDATTIGTATNVTTLADDQSGVTVGWVVSGVTVEVMKADTVTASVIATDAIGSAELATGAIGVDEFAAEADNIGINWADITNQGTAVDLSGTTVEWLGDADQSGVTVGAVQRLGDDSITTGSITDGAITDADVANNVQVDVASISTDATAANNLELMYDGTGYTDDTAPATRAQIDNIANVGAAVNVAADGDNTGGNIKGIAFVGSQVNTFTATAPLDGTYHEIADDTDTVDIIYTFAISGGNIPTAITWTGYMNGNNDILLVEAYDFVGVGWDQVGTIDGKVAATNETKSYVLFTEHVGTSGSDLGEVYIRFRNTATTPSQFNTDQLFLSYADTSRTIGYANGAIWVDTASGTSGTVNYVNGVADNPVDNWADALTISASLGLKTFSMLAGSSITLTANSDNYHFMGVGYNIHLNGQSMDGAFIGGASIIGNDDGSNMRDIHIHDSTLDENILGLFHMEDVSLAGGVTLAEAGTYFIDNSISGVAGTGTPYIDFQAGVGDQNLNMRLYSGGIQIQNFGGAGADRMSLEGNGQLKIHSSSSGGTIAVRGNFTVTDNVSGGFVAGGGVLSDDARYDVTQVNDQVVDVIRTDTIAEMSAGAPSGTTTISAMINYIFRYMRNKLESGTTSIILYDDAGTGVLFQFPHSESGATYTRSEGEAG